MHLSKNATTVALAFVSALLCFGQTKSAQSSIISKLAGSWALNQTKSTVAGSAPPLRFRSSADGGLEEVRGSDAAPLVEPVHFDGKSYGIDGGKASIVWKQTGPNQFERTSAADGQLVETRRITISDGGKTLTQVIERKPTTSTFVYSRSSGDGSGLAGVWQMKSRHQEPPPLSVISAVGTDSLKWINLIGVGWTAALDNKPVPLTGPGVISGTTVAFRQVDDYTIAGTQSRNGTITSTGTWKLSADGKMLTMTDMRAGPTASKEPAVSVYDKQP